MGCLCTHPTMTAGNCSEASDLYAASAASASYKTRPKPGDITTAFNDGEYCKALRYYQGGWIPSSTTFSDEDIVCVIAILTRENRLRECSEPAYNLTRLRHISEREVSKRVKNRHEQMLKTVQIYG